MPRPNELSRDEYARLLLQTIRTVRDEHHACTSREMGRRLQVPHQLINRQLDLLGKVGLVGWTPMPGSIHLTGRGGKVASGAPMPALPTKTQVSKNRTSQDVPPDATEPPLE